MEKSSKNEITYASNHINLSKHSDSRDNSLLFSKKKILNDSLFSDSLNNFDQNDIPFDQKQTKATSSFVKKNKKKLNIKNHNDIFLKNKYMNSKKNLNPITFKPKSFKTKPHLFLNSKKTHHHNLSNNQNFRFKKYKTFTSIQKIKSKFKLQNQISTKYFKKNSQNKNINSENNYARLSYYNPQKLCKDKSPKINKDEESTNFEKQTEKKKSSFKVTNKFLLDDKSKSKKKKFFMNSILYFKKEFSYS